VTDVRRLFWNQYTILHAAFERLARGEQLGKVVVEVRDGSGDAMAT
jgi:hypothetical protein